MFSHSVISKTLWPYGLQNTRLPCPSPSPGACSNSRPLSQWCHPTISPSVIPFSCLQSFPESGSFPMSQPFASGSQNIGASASAPIFPMDIQGWFPLGWTGLISLQSKGTLKSLLQHHSLKASVVQCLAFFMVQLSHPYMTTGKTIALTIWTFVGKVMSLIFVFWKVILEIINLVQIWFLKIIFDMQKLIRAENHHLLLFECQEPLISHLGINSFASAFKAPVGEQASYQHTVSKFLE